MRPAKIVDVERHRILYRGGQQFLSWPSSAREGRVPRMGCLRRELLRGQVAEARMRTFAIVLDAPFFGLAPRIVLAYFLQRQGFQLRLIPTLALARTREAKNNSWEERSSRCTSDFAPAQDGLSQTWCDPLTTGTND